MKRPQLLRIGTFAAAFVAAGLAGAAVRANPITLDVSATLTAVSGGAACTGTCTLGGHFVIDNTAGTVLTGSGDINVTASGFSPSGGPFMQFFSLDPLVPPPAPNTILVFEDSKTNDVELRFVTQTAGSLVGYAGGSVPDVSVHIGTPGGVGTWTGSGSLTAESVAVPAPSIGSGLPVVLILGGVLFGAKLLGHNRKQHSIAA